MTATLPTNGTAQGHDLAEIRREVNTTLDFFQERIAELEFALEDQGWNRLSGGSETEFSRSALKKICARSRLMFLAHPLINRAVTLQSVYVWGQGWNVQAKAPAVDEVVQAFLDDPANQVELTSHQARTLKEQDLQVEGNLFFTLFPDRMAKTVRVRTMPVDEVADIITNPEDAKEPWFYRRVWTERRLNQATGDTDTTMREEFYPDWRYLPATKANRIGDKPVNWDSPVYHVKVGGLSSMKFGVPETYAALDWASAYRAFLEDWATITRALARFAWQVKTPAGARGVAAARTKLNSTLNAGNAGGAETNPAPAAGAVWLDGGAHLDPIKTAGATAKAEDGRRLLLMVCAATGLPETFFGDVSVGTLATARSLDRPTELKFMDRRTLWADVFNDLFQYVISFALNLAPNVPEREVRIAFPPLLEHDVDEQVKAIVQAATLDGKAPAGTMDPRTLVRLLLTALGVDQVDELLDRIAPEGGVALMDQVQADKQAAAQAAADAEARQEPEQPAEALREAKRRTFGERVMRLREQLAKELEGSLGVYFEHQAEAAVLRLSLREADADAVDAVDAEEERRLLASILEAYYLRALEGIHDLTQDTLGIAFDLDDPLTRAYLEEAGSNIVGITDTTRRAVREALTEGQAAGEGIPQLAKRIRDLPEFSPARARTVARTELAEASNKAAVHTYEASGGIVVGVELFDQESDPECEGLNGKRLTLEEAKAHPKTIHPQCTLAMAPITDASLLPAP